VGYFVCGIMGRFGLQKEFIMQRFLLTVLPLLLIVQCSSTPEPINYEITLIERDGVFYTKDTNKPYSGPVFSLYGNGRMQRESILEDGKMITYKDIYWSENGQKMKEGTYKDGERDGLWTYWSENGQKMRERIYKDDKIISEREWNQDGSMKE